MSSWGEGKIRTATRNLAKGMPLRVFSTKGKLGWSGIVTNLETQVECLQIDLVVGAYYS